MGVAWEVPLGDENSIGGEGGGFSSGNEGRFGGEIMSRLKDAIYKREGQKIESNSAPSEGGGCGTRGGKDADLLQGLKPRS